MKTKTEEFKKTFSELVDIEFNQRGGSNNPFESPAMYKKKIELEISEQLEKIEELFREGFKSLEANFQIAFDPYTTNEERAKIEEEWSKIQHSFKGEASTEGEENAGFNFNEMSGELLEHCYLIAIELFNQGRYQECYSILQVLKYCDLAIPDFAMALGSTCIKLEKFDEAIVELERAVRLNPNHSQALIELIKLYDHLDRRSKKEHWVEFLKEKMEKNEIHLSEEELLSYEALK